MGPHLGKVDAVVGPGVQIDAMGTVIHHLRHENRCKPGCQGAFPASGEKPVQVSAVRQVSGMFDKTEHIDHRHSDEGSTHAF